MPFLTSLPGVTAGTSRTMRCLDLAIEMSNPSCRSRLRSSLRLTSVCDMEFHSAPYRDRMPCLQASSLISMLERDGVEDVGGYRSEGKRHDILKSNLAFRNFLRPGIDDGIDEITHAGPPSNGP